MKWLLFSNLLSLIVFSINGQTITFSFIANTWKLSNGQDGVLQATIYYSSTNYTTGTICSNNFGILEASVVCYQLGFDPVGVSYMDTTFTASSSPVVMSDVNCTGQVSLTNLSTVTIDRCRKQLTSNIPSTCLDHSLDVRLYCPNARSPNNTQATTTIAPATMPASTPCGTLFRLTGGAVPSTGRLEYNNGGVWGTVCANGMDQNAARVICQALCYNATWSSIYGRVLTTFANPNENILPVIMSGVSCPATAADFRTDCTYSIGGAVTCSHSQDAGLDCGPPYTPTVQIPTPLLTCSSTLATVFFAVNDSYAAINASSITLQNDRNCTYFNVSSNNTYVMASVHLVNCNVNVSMDMNYTSMQFTLLRQTYPVGGIYTRSPYTIGVGCNLPRNQSSFAPYLNSSYGSVSVNSQTNDSFQVALFSDSSYTNMVTGSAFNVNLYQTLYYSAQLYNTLSSFVLILDTCWATQTPDPAATPSIPIITNKCAVLASTQINLYSDAEIRFNFPTVSLSTSNPQIYVFCNGHTCDRRSADFSSAYCQRTCSTSGRRKRRSVDGLYWMDPEMEELPHIEISN